MTVAPGETFRADLAALDPSAAGYATSAVASLLESARSAEASDAHLTPTPEGLDVRWRVDGVLHRIATIPARVGPNVVARLKVLADLLTYRTDVPQEGRIRGRPGDPDVRISTFPTLHGERVVVRLFASAGASGLGRLDDLGFPGELTTELLRLLAETSGAVLMSGPAGSGKTTTMYACLRELVAATGGSRSLVSLEDPIEAVVPGVAQAQVNPAVGLDLAAGLRSLLRQDPEVIAVGEIRDRATAEVAVQASLTGHLVLTTFHAGSAAAAVGRLLDMGIEPYLLRSGIRAVVFQRLARRLCPECARPTEDPADFLGLDVARAFRPVGCAACTGTGYRGRIVLAELLRPDRGVLAQAVLARSDVERLEAAAIRDGMTTRWQRAVDAVETAATSPAEVRRVLGLED
jgi:type II secretory ATPase GspE/PulE/Tfp pilus assembly ATPase PilB-like protein